MYLPIKQLCNVWFEVVLLYAFRFHKEPVMQLAEHGNDAGRILRGFDLQSVEFHW